MPSSTNNQQIAQRLRMQRFFMSVALYGIWAVMTLVANAFGMIDPPRHVLWTLGLGISGTVFAFWLCIVTNANLRLADPSMTFLQCVIGLTWLNAFMYWVPEWRDLLISVYIIGLLFGVFQLQAREFTALAFIAFSGFVIMSGIDIALNDNQQPGDLLFRGGVVGSLLVWCAYFGNHVGSLRARLHMRNESLQAVVNEVTHLAERDHLTQAYNRRSIVDSLSKLRQGALRYDEAFSVVIIDIDFFKQVNDRFGHLTGDQVLMDFAARVRSELRLLDEIAPVVSPRQLGRYGGEEFILILPRTDLDGAFECAERIRKSTVKHSFEKELRITISAGVAQYTGAETIDDLLRRADKAMYEAKAAGRNTVIKRSLEAVEKSIKYKDVVNLSDYKASDE